MRVREQWKKVWDTPDRRRSACKELLLTAAAVMLILLLGPLDVFTHGYSCDVVDPLDVDAQDFKQFVNLQDEGYEFSFTPYGKHFRGLELYLDYTTENQTGTAVLTICNDAGTILDQKEVDLSEITSYEKIVIYVDADLKAGECYICSIEVMDVSAPVYIMLVDGDYLGEELEGDEILVGFIYAESTFSLSEKVLLSVLLAALWLALTGKILLTNTAKARRAFYGASVFLAMSFLLAWNYMYNFMDSENDEFDGYSDGSETLVVGPIVAQGQGIEALRYGLACYSDSMGYLQDYQMTFVTDDDWTNGFSNTGSQIRISNTLFTSAVAIVGNSIEFANGDIYTIVESTADADDLILTLDAGRHLNYYKYGDLSWIRYYDAQMNLLPSGVLYEYSSQFGLQGKIFRHLAAMMGGGEYLELFHLLCSAAAAVVFTVIVLLLKRKYNFLMAGCWYVVFLLSPWIVNFARNLYWVEFTWFLPMLTGLLCSLHIHSRKWRLVSCAGAFLTILLKSLCGYEYISTIMLGLIAFPIADLASSLCKKDKSESILLLRTIILMGMAALMGFAAAVLLHANLAGEGDLYSGFEVIFETMSKRTLFGNTIGFMDNTQLWESNNASVWETVLKYFNFNVDLTTQIITGIPGNLFPLLCLVPPLLMLRDYHHRNLREEEAVLYVVFFGSTLSWLILGKSHSYVHVHLNFVLWYTGYIQTCCYIILRATKDAIAQMKPPQRREENIGEKSGNAF